MSTPGPTLLSGAHLVETVLRHGRRKPVELVVLRGGSSRGLARTVKLAQQRGVPVRWADRDAVSAITGDPSADVAAAMPERESLGPAEVLPKADADVLVLALEGVEDPHNLGEILRTAMAARVDAVVLEEHARNMPRELVARSSAGASECLATLFTDNLARTLVALREKSVRAVAAVPDGGESLFDAVLGGRVALVIGGERRGLSRRVLEACDRRLTIPSAGAVQSLGAVSSAAVMLFEMVRRRGVK